MQNAQVTNPNDFKVVQFTNPTDFTFTPEMGCMYDGRPISGITGAPGINGGESMTLPYHIAHRLATNLAKIVMNRGANGVPQLDAQGNPIVKAIWNDVELERMKQSYLTELYTEDKPVTMSETDRLMAKVEEYKKTVELLMASQTALPVVVAPVTPAETVSTSLTSFQDKADVIAELEKRGIVHDKRQNKANLEKLLAPVAA